MNITLIGYRGTGKSTLGRALALRLGREFIDTDAVIVERAGKTIREIFAAGGEAAFRDLETAAVVEAAGKANCVIAVGGGAILRPQNVAALKEGGKIIWLQADAATLHARIAADVATAETRPHLAGGGLEEIEKLLAVRTPMYRAAADETLDVGGLSPEDAIGRLMALA